MSTANKLTYLNVTKQKLKQAINNIGGEVTDETTFREYVNQLENAYDRLPKTEFEEGESVTLENTLKGKLDFQDGKVGFGQASQESTQGYNLINVAGARVDNPVNGVSVSKDGDSIILNGSRTDGSTTNSKNVIYATNSLNLESGDYRLTFVPESGSLNGGRLGILFFNSNGGGIAYIEIFSGTTTTKSITLNSAVATLTVFYNGAFSATNYKFKVMLSQGTTERAYEQYTGGYASPSPNWEQEIKYVAGKNLINAIETNKHIDASGTILVDDAQFIGISEYVECKPNTTYSITFQHDVPSAQLLVGYKDKSGTFIQRLGYSTGRTFITPSNAYSVFFYVYVNGGSLTSGGYVQLEESPKPTPYLPYNTIEEVVSGKNKLNTANGSIAYKPEGTTITINSNGVINASADMGYASINIPSITLKAGKTYTFKRNFTGSYNSNFVDTNNNAVLGIGYNKTSATATFETDTVINKLNGALLSRDNYFWLEEGSTATTYEPYITPTSYQLSLGDIQLNAIGDYKDELIYDVVNDKVYKNEKIGKIVLDGSENYAESSYQPTSNLKFYLLQNIPDAKYLDGNSYVVGSALNNYLKDFDQNDYTQRN